jgi:NTE family protein
MNGNGPNKSALVLSGGGAYGAYEVGVIKSLFEGKCPSTSGVPLDPDIYTGTSVGNYNAAFLAMNEGGALESGKRLRAIWRDRIADNGDGRGNGVYRLRWNPYDYIDLRVPGSPIKQLQQLIADTASLGRAVAPRMLRFLSPHERLLEHMKDMVDISVFLNIEPFQRLVEDTIKPDAIRGSGKVLSVTATGWLMGDPQEFDFPRMTDKESWAAIRASAAIPALFPPVKLFDEVFIDGGVALNTPLGPAVDAGAVEIHVVSLNPKMMELPAGHIDNTLDTFNRVYSAMLVSKVGEDVASARWINEGIEVLERLEAGEDLNSETMQRFVRVARVIYTRLHQEGKLPNKVTIHRYYPNRALGDMLGMLNFHRGAIDSMIRDGFTDTCAHDCQANNCVIPAVVKRNESQPLPEPSPDGIRKSD